MKILTLVLNAVILLSATLFLAYVTSVSFDFGLFTVLPSGVSGVFLDNGALQFVALGLFAAAAIAKILVGRVLKRDESGALEDRLS